MPSLKLPRMAEIAGSATLLRWLKQAGDSFVAGERLAELETEDAFLALSVEAAGVLSKTHVNSGQTVEFGAELAHIQTAAGTPAIPFKVEKQVRDPSPVEVGSAVPILMPQAGNTMEEGTVVEWRVKVGDAIAMGQILCEIETDKATMEFESPAAGRLARILAPVGEPVAVKELIAVLAESDAAVNAFFENIGSASAAKAPTTANVVSAVSTHVPPAEASSPYSGERVKASPAARKLATARGVVLESIANGSGPGGRILSTDIGTAGSAKPMSGEGARRPLSKMRRAIGLNLQRSKQSIPHFYVRITIDASPLMAHYQELKPHTGCSVNDLVVLAVGRAMRDFPAVRSQLDGDHIVEFPHANIGVAVGVDDGLVVPVVMNVDTLSLAEVASETKRVVAAGRKGALENIGKGNFTISNLGMYGVEEFSAIINPPESGILAVSAVRETVLVQDGAMSPGRVMTLTLSADHRVVDGLLAAKFMRRLKEILEHPAQELN